MAQTREKKLVLTIASAVARREAMRLYRDLYKKEALMDGNRLLFSSAELYRDLTERSDFFVCKHCLAHFFRGLLLSVGSVTDPQKSYRLEFRLKDPDNLPFLMSLLEEKGWFPKCRTTESGVCVCFRKSADIEEIMALAGAGNGVFGYINAKIGKEIRNEENRATNCVTHNIRSAVRAAGKYCDAIELLKRAGKWETLSAELLETAMLRVENPEVSLSELALMHNPSITKSGLTHRLDKILKIAAAVAAKE